MVDLDSIITESNKLVVFNTMSILKEAVELLDGLGETDNMLFRDKHKIEVYGVINRPSIKNKAVLKDVVFFEELGKAVKIAERKQSKYIVAISIDIRDCMDTLNINVDVFKDINKLETVTSINKLKDSFKNISEYTSMRYIHRKGEKLEIEHIDVYKESVVMYAILDATCIGDGFKIVSVEDLNSLNKNIN